MTKTHITLIPGLGSGGVDSSNSDTWPTWVKNLRNRFLYEVTGSSVLVGNYTDPHLPEKIISSIEASGSTRVVTIGHSDGGACEVWIQSHVARLKESLKIDLFILLDDVDDLIRHGFLAALDPMVVDRAIRVFQTADPLIHSNEVVYLYGSVKKVENLWIGNPPFNSPSATHVDIPELPSVQGFITEQVLATTEGASAL